jgi:MFS family permease
VAEVVGVRKAIEEIRAGWRFIFENPVVRAVNLGLAAGLLGGAMLVPLGPTFAKYVIGDSNAFSLYITALGIGVALGVAALTAWQQRIPKERAFVAALLFAGVSILFGISMSTFWLSAVGVFGLGLGAGAVYILGYTLLQEHTDDDLRGRTFTTFLTLVRLCVLGAMVLGPAISALLDPLMKRLIGGRAARGMPGVRLFGVEYGLPGVRVTLWFGGVLILVASVIAGRSAQVSVRQDLRRIGGGMRTRAR